MGGYGAVQRALLTELRKQPRPINTVELLRIICDGDDPTHSQDRSARRALRSLAREGTVTAQQKAGMLFWRIITNPKNPIKVIRAT